MVHKNQTGMTSFINWFHFPEPFHHICQEINNHGYINIIIVHQWSQSFKESAQWFVRRLSKNFFKFAETKEVPKKMAIFASNVSEKKN